MNTSAFRRTTSTALAVAALATFSGCASMVSDADLNAQGRATFEKMRAEVPLVRDRPTIDFVSCVADAIVTQLDGEAATYEWELAIFDQQPVNAFVLPGGKISVYKGLLAITKNDAQLAAVMGHEVAHVTERHPAERMARTKATQVGVGVLSGIVGGTPIAAQSASTALQIGAQLGLLLPFNRGQENEADSVGLLYMARAGFDPRESIKLWQNMQNSKDNEPPEFMSTHPSSDTRIDRLVDMLPAALLEYNKARSNGLRPNCPRPSYLDPPKKPAGKT
ncbi:MAG: M48 family metallopeptidase [Pseudomonadota bacterium]